MPELPEVETVCRGLQAALGDKSPISQVIVNRYDLRSPIQRSVRKALIGQSILKVHRRAKYLLFETEKFTIISHLGMSGFWRLQDFASKPHDHLTIEFQDGKKMIYCDPRRFGIFRYVKTGMAEKSQWLNHLGVEPLSADFHVQYLLDKAKSRKATVKSLIMDQNIVVGIGNIYASEILFLAGVRPLKMASRLSGKECVRIVESTRIILSAAIQNKGTTLKDYRQTSGDKGTNQNQLAVYGRAQLDCNLCSAIIRSQNISGRSTYWCPRCQR